MLAHGECQNESILLSKCSHAVMPPIRYLSVCLTFCLSVCLSVYFLLHFFPGLLLQLRKTSSWERGFLSAKGLVSVLLLVAAAWVPPPVCLSVCPRALGQIDGRVRGQLHGRDGVQQRAEQRQGEVSFQQRALCTLSHSHSSSSFPSLFLPSLLLLLPLPFLFLSLPSSITPPPPVPATLSQVLLSSSCFSFLPPTPDHRLSHLLSSLHSPPPSSLYFFFFQSQQSVTSTLPSSLSPPTPLPFRWAVCSPKLPPKIGPNSTVVMCLKAAVVVAALDVAMNITKGRVHS